MGITLRSFYKYILSVFCQHIRGQDFFHLIEAGSWNVIALTFLFDETIKYNVNFILHPKSYNTRSDRQLL